LIELNIELEVLWNFDDCSNGFTPFGERKINSQPANFFTEIIGSKMEPRPDLFSVSHEE
jgi:hypothetical protein